MNKKKINWFLNSNSTPAQNSYLTDWLAVGTSNGFTLPSGTDLSNLNTFLNALQTAGILAHLDALRIYKNVNNISMSRIDFINPAATLSTNVNSPGFDNAKGSFGNASNSYINLNVTPSGLTKFTKNNGAAFTYLGDTFNVTDSGGIPLYFGCNDGTGADIVFGFINPTLALASVNDQGAQTYAGLPQVLGLQLIQRVVSTTVNLIQNGTTYPITMASSNVPTTSMALHARNANGTPQLFTSAKQALWGIGDGLAGLEGALKTACDAFYAA